MKSGGPEKEKPPEPLRSSILQLFFSIQLDFQDIDIVDHSVIGLANTLVNKWNPQMLQQSDNSSGLLSLNLLYNYNIDVAGVGALEVPINHFSVNVRATISCEGFNSPHIRRR